MNIKLPLPSLFLLLFWLFSCQSAAPKEEKASQFLGIPTADIESELTTLITKWYPRIVDTINGGYWTNFEFDWRQSDQQAKMLVTQARGLWTAARMVQFYPENEMLRAAADHGFDFLTTTLWDAKNGGFYLNWTPENPTPTTAYHLTYANAFVLYAFAEYAKINKDPAVISWVKKTFDWLEERAHDPKELGYFNLVFLDDALAKASKDSPERLALGWGGGSWKGQNTSIHLLEALTNAYQVLPTPLVKERLAEMLGLVRDKFVHPDGYLQLYYTNDWDVISYKDSSRQFILDHLRDDHVSFGHDIETAFLLLEASETLYGEKDERTMLVAKRMLDHTLKTGFDHDYLGLFDKGYYFKGVDTIEILGKEKTWWAEAEAWHSLALFSLLYPENKDYPYAFRQMWTYLQENIIDHAHGGWYGRGIDENPDSKNERKAHAWKGAYHNGRSLVQVLEYARGVE
ncbi:MAG: AGE family epimerase/isomerase [Saprospiraceae bacterium]